MARALSKVGLGMVLVIGIVLGPSAAAGDTAQYGEVDLSIEVAANPAVTGSVIQYESTVRNRGTRVAEKVIGTFEIPVAAVTVGIDSESCTVVGSTRLESGESAVDQPWLATCDFGSMLPGSEKRVAFSVTLGRHGTWTGTASVSGNLPDARPFDNRIDVLLFVLPGEPAFTPAFQQPGGSNPTSRANI